MPDILDLQQLPLIGYDDTDCASKVSCNSDVSCKSDRSAYLTTI